MNMYCFYNSNNKKMQEVVSRRIEGTKGSNVYKMYVYLIKLS